MAWVSGQKNTLQQEPLGGWYDQAESAYRAGDWRAAQSLLSISMSMHRDYAPAWHLLGTVNLSAKDLPAAADAFHRALELAPDSAVSIMGLADVQQAQENFASAMVTYEHALVLDPALVPARVNLGVVLRQLGRSNDAKLQWEEALRYDPQNAIVHENLGLLNLEAERIDDAIACFKQAIRLEPHQSDLYNRLGDAYWEKGETAQAIAAYEHALGCVPTSVHALNNLGILRHESGDDQAAAALFRRVLDIDPRHVDALSNLAQLLIQTADTAGAVQCLHRAVAADPNFVSAYNDLGFLYGRIGEPHRALEMVDRALSLDPASGDGYNNRGLALLGLGEVQAALPCFEKAARLLPNDPRVQVNWATGLLLSGDFARGWDKYEWRGHHKDSSETVCASYPIPVWNGEELTGKTLLIHAEQGLGDEIMFSSLIPEIAAQTEQCILTCAPKLRALFARSFPGVTVIAVDHGRGFRLEAEALRRRCGRVDYQIRIGSLARFRRRSPATFPQHKGYLHADSLRVGNARKRLSTLGGGLKIGLSWRGGLEHTGATRRSVAMTDLTPLTKLKGCRFINLQYNTTDDERRALASGRHTIVHWQDVLDDYDETAAMVAALDLVISVCTSVIHLGGALGQPVWVLVPRGAEWRYGAEGEHMLWYPSVRLLRQEKETPNWHSVIARAAADVQTWTAAAA